MNIKKIRAILKLDISDEMQEYYIKHILAEDENVIPDILSILSAEREAKKELILEMNLQLSRAETGLSVPDLNEDDFMQEEIRKFYAKYKDHVGHCFKKYSEEDLKDEENENII